MHTFIGESAIFQEAKIVKSEAGKAIFRMVLQSVDEVNQNRRLYPKKVLVEGMESVKSRMARRAFFGEMDHPFPQGNETFDAVRQTTVSLEKVSHIIRDFDFRGNQLIGELETSSTPNGRILLGLLKDKAGIGMSMRGMAELELGEDHNIVKSPLTIISFDAVSLPSHESAVVDFNEMKFEQSILQEKVGMICCGDKCYLPDHFDKLVETKVIQFFERWV